MPASALLLPLDAIGGSGLADVGGKAHGLARLARLGLPVPPGFCVTAAAYRAHVSAPAVRARIEAALAAREIERADALASVRRAIAESPLDPSLACAICESFASLGGPVAVRSSATAEDLSGFSFAGQHDTHLGVADADACVRAVAACWASLWTGRAFEYRARAGFDHARADMAVVVQAMVQPDAAGVLFTADPISGDRDRVVIEAVRGLGDALVSGRVSPERLVLARSDLAPIEGAAPCLEAGVARRVAELALRAEREFCAPLDVEWAALDGSVFLLQARPITTLRAESDEDRQIWSNVNAGEVLPDVVSPITWSVIQELMRNIFVVLLARLGLDIGDHPVITRVAGRVYFSLNFLAGVIRRVPGLRELGVEQVLGGLKGKLSARELQALADKPPPGVHFSWLRALLALPGLASWFVFRSPRRAGAFLTRVQRSTDALAQIDALDEPALLGRLQAITCDQRTFEDIIAFAGIGMMWVSQLFEFCRRRLADGNLAIANRLLAGAGGLDSAEAGLAMWRLAAFAHARSPVREALLAGAGLEEVDRVPGGAEFRARWDAFATEHGHHTRGEIDVINPRWSEQPDLVLGLVRGWLRGMGEADPEGRLLRIVVERDALAEDCRRRLRNPIERELFAFLVRRAREGCAVRENMKSQAVRRFAVARKLLLALGARLARRGVIALAQDVFFLEVAELPEACAGTGMRGLVADRRAERTRDLALDPPPVVVGRYDPARHVPEPVDRGATVLTGLGVSPGSASGPARVILRADDHEHVLPGEVLVAPFTDPGWTPYFQHAAAIVMDLGGLLSHGSIVAREYGIPCVVNVGPATRIVRTGRMIHVDGDRGVVKLGAEPEAGTASRPPGSSGSSDPA